MNNPFAIRRDNVIRNSGLLFVACICVLFSRVATADLVRVDWSGTVTSGGAVTGTIDIGNTITGTFIYDAASPRATAGICSFGVVCANYETMHDSSFSVNGLSGSQSDSEIFIFNDRVSGSFGELMFDQFHTSPAITSTSVYSGDLLAGFSVRSIFVRFYDSTSTALSDISLPSFLDENDFDNLVTSRIDLVGFLDNDSVQFLIDSFTFTSVSDADGDGVNNDADLCPMTLPGDMVDANGCSANEAVDLVVAAIFTLIDSPVSDKARDKLGKTQDKLNDALAELAQGDVKKGLKKIGGAVKQLLKAEKEGVNVSDLIDQLVELARAQAQAKIDKAIASGGDSKKIAKAQNELAKAEDELANGKPDKAIDHYAKAWDQAQKA